MIWKLIFKKHNIKNRISVAGRKAVSNRFCWKIIYPLVRFFVWINYLHSPVEHEAAEKRLKNYFADKIVRNGFFKGLKYPDFNSFGSSIFPKLLGSYEIELLPFLDRVRENKYSFVIDIGCGEGFYAVGLAIKFSGAIVNAYDIDVKALDYCKHLAAINGVSEKMRFHHSCTAATFDELNMPCYSLLICDCEGYERELFTQYNVARFQQTDMIIELHPFATPAIREYLSLLLLPTHHIEIISSYDNARKMFDHKNNLQELTNFEQQKAVEEGRPCTMDWLVAESKYNKTKKVLL